MYTPDNPPKSGKALKLWKWWIGLFGDPPDMLFVNRPGRHQLSEGTPRYMIESEGFTYSISNPDKTLLKTREQIEDAPHYDSLFYV